VAVTQEQVSELVKSVNALDVKHAQVLGSLAVTNAKIDALVTQLQNDARARRYALTLAVSAVTALATIVSVIAIVFR
jgi:hypothetical protein